MKAARSSLSSNLPVPCDTDRATDHTCAVASPEAQRLTTGTSRHRSRSVRATLQTVVLLAVLICNPLLGSHAAEPPVTALVFAPDGTALIAGSEAGVTIYSWPDLKRLRDLDSVVDDVHDLRFAPNGKYLAVAGGVPAESGGVRSAGLVHGQVVVPHIGPGRCPLCGRVDSRFDENRNGQHGRYGSSSPR